MRLYRNAIILLVVLGLLIGTYFVMKNNKPDEDTASDDPKTESVKVLKLDEEKITQITVQNGESKFVFDKKKKSWTISYPNDLKILTNRVSSISYEVSNLEADKLIEDNAKDFSQYGLDKPSQVIVNLNDGTTKVVEIGNATPSDSGYYMKLKDGKAVYQISTYKGEVLRSGVNDIMDKSLLVLEPEDVTGFTMEKAGKVTFATKKAAENEWVLTEPIKGNVQLFSLDQIFNTLRSLSVTDFVEVNAKDLSKYGLDKPAYSFEVVAKKVKTKVYIGDEKVKGTEFYAKLADGSQVFTLDAQFLTFIDKPLKEMLEVFAYIADITNVNKLEVNMDGKTVVSDISVVTGEKEDTEKFVVDGKDVTYVKDDDGRVLFKSYYETVIGVKMYDLERGVEPKGTPEITFTYHLKKAPNTMKVEFIPKNEYYYYVVKNGEYSNIIVDKEDFKAIRDAYKKLMDEAARMN